MLLENDKCDFEMKFLGTATDAQYRCSTCGFITNDPEEAKRIMYNPMFTCRANEQSFKEGLVKFAMGALGFILFLLWLKA